jgi:hypothetical protein
MVMVALTRHSAPGDRWTVRAASCRRQNCGRYKARSWLPVTLRCSKKGAPPKRAEVKEFEVAKYTQSRHPSVR